MDRKDEIFTNQRPMKRLMKDHERYLSTFDHGIKSSMYILGTCLHTFIDNRYIIYIHIVNLYLYIYICVHK